MEKSAPEISSIDCGFGLAGLSLFAAFCNTASKKAPDFGDSSFCSRSRPTDPLVPNDPLEEDGCPSSSGSPP